MNTSSIQVLLKVSKNSGNPMSMSQVKFKSTGDMLTIQPSLWVDSAMVNRHINLSTLERY
jgi:hypothetical protein